MLTSFKLNVWILSTHKNVFRSSIRTYRYLLDSICSILYIVYFKSLFSRRELIVSYFLIFYISEILYLILSSLFLSFVNGFLKISIRSHIFHHSVCSMFLSDFLALADPVPLLEFEQLPFNHPLFIMYSSGTTGHPKCLVHSAGVRSCWFSFEIFL